MGLPATTIGQCDHVDHLCVCFVPPPPVLCDCTPDMAEAGYCTPMDCDGICDAANGGFCNLETHQCACFPCPPEPVHPCDCDAYEGAAACVPLLCDGVCGGGGGVDATPLCVPLNETAGVCVCNLSAPGPDTCQPVTSCLQQQWTCGQAPNGCGGVLDCGACGEGLVCIGFECQMLPPTCGDGLVNAPGEECDDGAASNGTPNSTCTSACTLARCGDGIWQPWRDEACDGGLYCNTTTCTFDPQCQQPLSPSSPTPSDALNGDDGGNSTSDAALGGVCLPPTAPAPAWGAWLGSTLVFLGLSLLVTGAPRRSAAPR